MSFKSEEKHKHKMENTITEKVILWKADNLEGKTERVYATGYDIITSKQCECGFKEAIGVEREIQS